MARIAGTLNNDSNNTPVQRARGITTIDGSGSPLQSPQSVTSSTEVVIKAPPYTVAVILGSTQDLYCCEATGVSAAKSFYLKGGSVYQFDLEAGRSLYFKAVSTTGSLSYIFQIIPN